MASPLAPGVNVSITDSPVVLAGVATNSAFVVGTATWGPVNIPITVGNYLGYTPVFGIAQPRKYDMGTAVQQSSFNGASGIIGLRVTDGTDTAASVAIANATCSALYTGSAGSTITLALAAGGKANTVTATVAMPGALTEVYPNLAASNAAVLTTSLTGAINTGAGVARNNSQLVRISGTLSSVPTVPVSYSLVGGTDGATTITAATLVGSNAFPPTGMYAMAGQNALVGMLADADDSTQWTTQAAWGQQNNCLMVEVEPASTASQAGITAKQTAGLDSQYAVLLAGDWVSYDDPVNGLRTVSPQGQYLGARSALLPFQSVLNKPLNGIATTQRVASHAPYSSAEIALLSGAGVEVITNPISAGASFGCAVGVNTSSNISESSDAWTMLTNYLTLTLKGGMGSFVGLPITPTLFTSVTATLSSFLSQMKNQQGMISAYTVTCNATNNPQPQQAAGILSASVTAVYFGIVRQFNIQINAGSDVTISSSTVSTLY